MDTEGKKFRDLFCEHFQCTPEKYEPRMFQLCLYRHALLFAPLLRFLSPDFFSRDLATIRQLGIVTSHVEFHDEVEDYFYHMHSYGNFLQRVWRLRISGRRLLLLSSLFAPAPPVATPPK